MMKYNMWFDAKALSRKGYSSCMETMSLAPACPLPLEAPSLALDNLLLRN